MPKNKNENASEKVINETFQSLISLGEKNKLIAIKERRITYLKTGKSYNLQDPEEIVRASFYVKLIDKYKYPENRIDLEVVVPRRTPSDSADIVVYEDDARKRPYIVVECKKEGIPQSAISQAIEQAFGNANSLRAPYAIMVAGSIEVAFDVAGFDPQERDKNIISDIPIRYGKVVKFKFKKADPEWDLKSANLYELQSRLQQCHDIIWQGGKRNPAEAFDEMSKLMFCKDKDERVLTPINDSYNFQIGTHESAKEVADRIREIYKKAQAADPLVFESPIRLEDEIIYSVVEKLQGVSLSRTELDAKGRAFETFLGKIFRGEMGQYFTPRTIVQFMVDILEPNFEDVVIDPACGSGGFLLYALDKIRQYAEQKFGKEEGRVIWKDRFALYQLYGIEINSLLVRVAMMNMIIHEDGHSNIENGDALDSPSKFHPRRDIRLGKYSLLLTNPPFGAVVKEQEHNYLRNYQLGGKSKKTKQNTEILFIERGIDLLAENGRMGIVLPDGILMSKALSHVRDLINEKAQVLAVVSLPQSAFMPSGAGVKSSLLFLRKKKEGEKIKMDSLVFMATAEHIGYDATGKWDENQLPVILQNWQRFKKGETIKNGSVYAVSFNKINNESRFDAYYFQPKFDKLEKSIRSYKNVKRLEDVVEFLEYGLMPTQDYAKTPEEGVPMIRVTNITTDGRINMSDIKYIPFNTPRLDEKRVKEGDVLMVQCGNTTGKVALVPKELEGYTYGSFSFAIRPKKSILLPEYLELVLRSEVGQLQIWRTINIATVRPNTSKPDVKNLLIPIPSLKEQKKIIDEVKSKREKIDKAREQISELIDSIDGVVPQKLKISFDK